MRGWIPVVGLASVAGCGGPKPMPMPPPPIVEVRCTNPANCTVSNGTGVYFAEGGAAGMGTMHFMITRFINGPDGVHFQGRYFDAATNNWRVLDEPGNITQATFTSAKLGQQSGVAVVSVVETATVPTWTFSNGGPASTSVTGTDLVQLELSIAFEIPGVGTQQFVLDFAPNDRQDPQPRQTAKYIVRARSVNDLQSVDYCTDANGAPDPVVLEQSITVEPVNGTVTPDPTAVTMSCDLGAAATVYRWGYDYTADLFYFAAGIQMKRDSYCGDFNYYTVSGTEILISDDRAPDRAFPVNQLEAWWTPAGAACADPQNARHPDVVRSKNFNWQCGGKPLPTCPGIPSSKPYLIDALRPPS